MVRKPALASLLAALLLPSGCLEWEEQELRVAYDAERDRIDAQIVYRGLASGGTSPWSWFGTAKPVEDVEGTETELAQLLDGRPMCALLFPILGFDLAALRESDDPLVAAIAQRVSVDRGAFFRAADGRLCAWQHLRITSATEVVGMFDALLRRELGATKDLAEVLASFGCEDPESARRWREALAKDEPRLELRGASVVLKIPASELAARALAKRIESAGDFAKLFERPEAEGVDTKAAVERRPVGRPSDAETCAAFLRALDVHATVVAGAGGADGRADLVLDLAAHADAPIRFRAPADGERFDLAPHLEQRKVPIRADVTDEFLRAAFAQFRRF